jgi:hypothetical protein
MQIEITYLFRNSKDSQIIKLNPEEYFDPLEPGETFEEDGIPIYSDAFDYIGCSAHDLEWAIEKILSGKGKRIVRRQYLDGDRSMMVHVTEPDGSEEIIHSTEIEKDKWHIIRTYKSSNGSWSVIMNGLTDENPKTNHANISYEECWSYEKLVNFCKIY